MGVGADLMKIIQLELAIIGLAFALAGSVRLWLSWRRGAFDVWFAVFFVVAAFLLLPGAIAIS